MPNRRNVDLQNRLYKVLKEQRVKTKIYLINGYQLDGIIKAFDNFTILIIKDGKELLIYKHAISTIEPLRAISHQF